MEKVAWLVELSADEAVDGPKWFCASNGVTSWTTDPNKALRFARKEDADNFKSFWCVTAVSTEHTWCVEKVAGMYAVSDPSYPQVKVGRFTICRQDDVSVWIQNEDGEGCQFSDTLFEAAILDFWRKHF